MLRYITMTMCLAVITTAWIMIFIDRARRPKLMMAAIVIAVAVYTVLA